MVGVADFKTVLFVRRFEFLKYTALAGMAADWNMILIKLNRMHKLLEKERTQHGPEANDKFSSQEMRAAVARLKNLFNDLRLFEVMWWENKNNKSRVKNWNNYQ